MFLICFQTKAKLVHAFSVDTWVGSTLRSAMERFEQFTVFCSLYWKFFLQSTAFQVGNICCADGLRPTSSYECLRESCYCPVVVQR